MTTAMGDVTVTPGSAVGRLGEDAAAAEAAAAAAKVAAAASRDTAKPADQTAQTPEQKAEADKVAAVTAAEAKVAAAKTPEEKTAAETELAKLKGDKAAAPEKYEAFKLPEGVKLDETMLAEVTPVFKELGLSQEQAQKLVDFQAKRVADQAKAAADGWATHMDTTLATAKGDKDVGGQNWDKSLGYAKAFIKSFGTPALQEYLNTAEAGSHVEVIRAFAKAGKAVSEDGFVPGAASVSAPKSLAERMFPNHKP